MTAKKIAIGALKIALKLFLLLSKVVVTFAESSLAVS